MGELHRHARVFQLLAQDGFPPGLFFKVDDVGSELVFLRIVSHVEQTERHLSEAGRGRHEVAAFHDALYQFVGQRLPCLIMEGEGAQEFFLYGKVLHKL